MCPVCCQCGVATLGVPVEQRPEYPETCKAHGGKKHVVATLSQSTTATVHTGMAPTEWKIYVSE